ncbi:hypothetical protein [Sphingomonas sp. 3-13AW]|uniref:hypothetical protein n=1 Tax=Sphingomonas sp. 3-13AW TaxID=3050450 RepID=UPI003BB5BB12
MLPEPPLAEQAREIAKEMLQAGMRTLLVADEAAARVVYDTLRQCGITVTEVHGYATKEQAMRDEGRCLQAGFPGEAGREISNIRKMAGVSA